MKKTLLLSFCCALGIGAQAQKIRVTNFGEEVANKTIITYYANKEVDEVEETVTIMAGPEQDPLIHNLTTTPLTLQATVTKSSSGSQWDKVSRLSWCFGECSDILDDSYTRQTSVAAAGDGQDYVGTMLHCYFNEGDYATALAKVEIKEKVGLAANDLITYYIKFIYDEEHLGINDLNATAPAFLLDGRTLTYSFTTDSARRLNFYTVDGRLAASYSLNDAFGTINLEAIPAGVYVMNLAQGNKTVKSRKIVLGQ